jgi:hypothetical protein
MGIVPDAPTEFLDQARLPDSWLTHHQHELALAVARMLPATQKQAHIVFAPNERRQGARRATGRVSAHHRRSDGPRELNRILDALKLMRAAIFDYEQSRNELVHCRGNHNRIGLCRRLHPQGDIRRITEYISLLAAATAHHDRTGLDPDANRQPQIALNGKPSVQRIDVFHDCEASADRAFGIILVGLRPAEVNHHPVDEVLGDMTTKACDRSRGRSLILSGYIVPVFGIEMTRDLCRVDQV